MGTNKEKSIDGFISELEDKQKHLTFALELAKNGTSKSFYTLLMNKNLFPLLGYYQNFVASQAKEYFLERMEEMSHAEIISVKEMGKMNQAENTYFRIHLHQQYAGSIDYKSKSAVFHETDISRVYCLFSNIESHEKYIEELKKKIEKFKVEYASFEKKSKRFFVRKLKMTKEEFMKKWNHSWKHTEKLLEEEISVLADIKNRQYSYKNGETLKEIIKEIKQLSTILDDLQITFYCELLDDERVYKIYRKRYSNFRYCGIYETENILVNNYCDDFESEGKLFHHVVNEEDMNRFSIWFENDGYNAEMIDGMLTLQKNDKTYIFTKDGMITARGEYATFLTLMENDDFKNYIIQTEKKFKEMNE